MFSLNITINGFNVKFILDFGAGECNISPETEIILKAKGIITQKDYLSNGLYRMADGSIVENRRVKISKMAIGNKTVSNLLGLVPRSSASPLILPLRGE